MLHLIDHHTGAGKHLVQRVTPQRDGGQGIGEIGGQPGSVIINGSRVLRSRLTRRMCSIVSVEPSASPTDVGGVRMSCSTTSMAV